MPTQVELTSWPLDNKPYTSQALGAAYAARSRGLLYATDFAATANGDNTVTIAPGAACLHVNEYWATFPCLLRKTVLQLEDADGALPRWDAIALVYDKNANTVTLTARTGQAASSPALPALRRDSDYDEVLLYRITRPKGATEITAADIVDLRLDPACCGLMQDTLNAVDTSVMQAQFAAWLDRVNAEADTLQANYLQAFAAWFDLMKDQLSEDAAGNLQLQTDALRADLRANAPQYTATYTLDGWAAASETDAANGWAYTQTVALAAVDTDAPAVTADSRFLAPPRFAPVGVPATDERLGDALDVINAGPTTCGDGTVTTLVQEMPEAEIEIIWTMRV